MNKKKINNSLFDFTNSNVYIIGGSGLIGAKIVNDFLSLGANVISLDNSVEILMMSVLISINTLCFFPEITCLYKVKLLNTLCIIPCGTLA